MIDIEKLNELLNAAYQLGRENENRSERGIPELDAAEAFQDWVDNIWLPSKNT